ncbi:MAG: hypothetical protein V7752_12995 [Halopseudomonas sp.]
MVPKPIYEVLPYLYLLSGSIIIAALGGHATLAGLLLFCFGSWLWLVRSDYRRINARQPKSLGSRFYWSDTVYELQPFGYILAGVLVFGLLQHPIRLVSGPLMVMIGIAVLMLRASQRQKPQRIMRVVRGKNETFSAQPMTSVSYIQQASEAGIIAAAEVERVPEFQPQSTDCDSCQIVDICNSVKFNPRSVQEIMRLSQTVAPDEAFGLYREVVERIEKRRVSDDELRSVLSLLYSYSDHCTTWRKTGRLASL